MEDTNVWFRAARSILRVVFVTLNNLYCIPTYLLWTVLLWPLSILSPKLYWQIEGKLFKWLLAMVAAWSWSAGYTIEEVGEDVSACHDQECLLIVNHQSTGDVPLLMAAFQNKSGVVANMMWLMDRLFKYTNFGVVSYAHGDFFIKSGKDVRQSELESLRQHLKDVYIGRHRKWLVLFPEGGFLHKRIATSQKYAKANNLPHLENVSLPRLGAMHTIINTLNPVEPGHVTTSNHTHNSSNSYHEMNNREEGSSHANTNHFHHFSEARTRSEGSLTCVLDITIAYPQGVPLDLLAICTGSRPRCKTVMHYRRFPIEAVPTDLDGMTTWLYDRWVEKEVMLNTFYETGHFPVLPSDDIRPLETPPQAIELDNAWLVALHVFFIASTLLHCYLLSALVRLCICYYDVGYYYFQLLLDA